MPRLRLRQALALDEFGNLGHELGLDEHGIRIRHADISVDVAAAYVDRDRMNGFAFTHGAHSFAADSTAFNRSRIKAISCFGVSILFLAFF
jgi:hypothetical protein